VSVRVGFYTRHVRYESTRSVSSCKGCTDTCAGVCFLNAPSSASVRSVVEAPGCASVRQCLVRACGARMYVRLCVRLCVCVCVCVCVCGVCVCVCVCAVCVCVCVRACEFVCTR